MHVTHRTVAQSKIGFSHRAHLARGHFQHLQRAFTRGAEARTGSQEYCPPEIQLSRRGKRSKVIPDNSAGDCTQFSAKRLVSTLLIEETQELRRDDQIGETTCHQLTVCVASQY